jgi:hypothetical protein
MQITVRELREAFAEKLTGRLNTGDVPWHDNRLPLYMPRSLTNAKNFSGINAVILMLTEIEKRYDDPRWVFYQDSLYLKRGEKGVFLEWWNKNGDKSFEFRSILCFNARQLYNYPPIGEMLYPDIVSARRVLESLGIPSPSPVTQDGSGEEASASYLETYDKNKDEWTVFRVKEWHESLKTALKSLESSSEIPWNPRFFSYKEHLYLLRLDLSVSFLTLSLGMGVPELDKSLPLDAWSSAIRQDPSEIARATLDAQKLVHKVLSFKEGSA